MTMLCGRDFLCAWLHTKGEDLSEGLESILSRYPNISIVVDETGTSGLFLVEAENKKTKGTAKKVLLSYFGHITKVELSVPELSPPITTKEINQPPFWSNDWRNKRKKR